MPVWTAKTPTYGPMKRARNVQEGGQLRLRVETAAQAGYGIARGGCVRLQRWMAEARSNVRCRAVAPARSLKLCDEPGNERSHRQEKPVAELKHCHCSRHRGRARRPAPSWQSAPYIHEGRRSRKKRAYPVVTHTH